MTNASRRLTLVAAHIVGWLIIIVFAYRSALQAPSASCWQIALLLIPGLNLLIIGIGIVSLVVLVMSIFDFQLRSGWKTTAALHGAILVAGLVSCGAAASAAAGQVDCL